ncbi:MAG: EAL domain-containing protein [Epulopiscium sp.]|nr:EAL domain-containing protein [Candidatus Epulonipiscium sp.]
MSDILNNIMETAEQIADWVIVTDICGVILYANPEVENLSGYSKEELIGNKPSKFKSDLVSNDVYEKLWETILRGEPYLNLIVNRHKNGNLFHLANTISPIRNKEGEIKYFISIAKSLNNEGKLKRQIHNAVHNDRLTGLLNRNSFIAEMSLAKLRYKKFAVIAISINKLGLINNKYGFLFGDKVIREVGIIIGENTSPNCVLSRVESKVFGLIVPSYESEVQIINMINKIDESLNKPFKIKGEEVYVSVSYGITTYTSDNYEEIKSKDHDLLLTRAQLALSSVKKYNTLQRYEFYTPEMNKRASNIISMESEIYTAYKNDEFISFYQPFIDLTSGEICGLEALMRRQKPTGEIIAPNQFIESLEETGLIIEVGFSLIEKICRQMRNWIDTYGCCPPVSINLSPTQFKDEFFCEKLIAIIEKEKVPTNLITLEITESMLIEDVNRTVCILERLRSHGFTISLDDFGTGYSSLSYIQRFKINTIKVDMSFIRNIRKSQADQAIVKAIIMMAKALDLKTIAEGVETKEQVKIIKDLGCDIGQGFYWDKPMPAKEIRF